MGKGLRGSLLLLAGLLLLGLFWFGYSADPKITALRNVIFYKIVKAVGGPKVHTEDPAGAITGMVHDVSGEPVPGAVVLVSSPLGHSYSAGTGPDGQYRIDGVPPGRYVPVAGKRGYDDAFNQTCLAGLCFKHAIAVQSDSGIHWLRSFPGPRGPARDSRGPLAGRQSHDNRNRDGPHP